MGALIFGYCFAGFFLVLSLLSAPLQQRRVADADDDAARDLRRYAESSWTDYMPGVWSLLSAVGGGFFIAREHPIGWGWVGVGVLWAVALIVSRRSRSRVLDALGERGRRDMPARYKTSKATAYHFATVGVAGYVVTRIVEYAYPDDPPTGAMLVIGLAVIASMVGAIGFAVVWFRVYMRGDNLPRTDA